MSIEVKHVSKTFGSYVALDDVSVKVHDGEMVALLGPSGSGKTTLLRIIAGLELPDERANTEIRFDEANVTEYDVRQRRVGFVFQHYALFRHMNVFDNVAFGLAVRPRRQRPSKSDIRERVHHLLKLVQLEGFANRYPSQLSGGQRQRIALARALAVEPQVLLLDEPFGALDAQVRKGLREWLRRLHEEVHLTSILVTHDQEEALEVADRVVVMNQARIEQVGTPDQVFHHPSSEFVMRFLGTVNVFHGRVHRGTASVGNVQFACPEHAEVEDHAATIYLRPHELEVRRETNGKPGMNGRVQRVLSAGANTKLMVQTDYGHEITVDLPVAERSEEPLHVGDSVVIYPKSARVFVPDYHI